MTIDLLDILAEPQQLATLDAPAMGQIVHYARHAALLGYLQARIDPDMVQGRLGDHLLGARIQADFFDRQMRWEIRSLEQVLGGMDGPVILLKGAAYKVLELELASGRLASDVDLLLPKVRLHEAEVRLLEAGWESVKEDEYEQQYYREWMHELPPLRHAERGTVVDLHHAILPPTSRVQLDSVKLLEDAVPIPGSTFYTLSPADTVLHRCVHLFVDGDLHNSLRELVDLHGLLCAFEGDEQFLVDLVSRARELGLEVPLYYAVYFCGELLAWQVPDGLLESLGGAPGLRRRFIRLMMGWQLRPYDPMNPGWRQRISAALLYMRSHWLRMPALMLVKHLARQSWRRGGVQAGGAQG